MEIKSISYILTKQLHFVFISFPLSPLLNQPKNGFVALHIIYEKRVMKIAMFFNERQDVPRKFTKKF